MARHRGSSGKRASSPPTPPQPTPLTSLHVVPGPAPTPVPSARSKTDLKQIFLALGYDKTIDPPAAAGGDGGDGGEEKKEEGGDGDGAAAAAPAAPAAEPRVTDNAEQAFDLLAGGAATVHVAVALGRLHVCKAGFGEPALRFALKAVAADETGSLKEAPLHVAVTTATNMPYPDWTPVMRNHLRRAWRAAEKFAPPPPEAPPAEDGGDAPPPPPPPAVDPADAAVIVDDFVAKVGEDEVLASLLTKEVAVPIEAPPPPPEAAE